MKKEIINTPAAPAAIGPYSQAVCGNGILYISGQIPLNPETGTIPETIEGQTIQALNNLLAVLQAGGTTPADVLKTTVYITDMKNFPAVNEIYAGFFPAPYPARACVEVAALPKNVLIEIDAVALSAPSYIKTTFTK